MRHNNACLRCTSFALAFVATLFWASAVWAQTTSFTYQGRLTDSGMPANGNYDLRFGLFDSASSGTQIGATQTSSNVLVSAGIFTVSLDFGAGAFPGAPRFLEISARLTGAGSFTTLAPRQQITSTPYAIRSLNASTADTVTVNGVPGGSGNYIQNTTTPQSANFNISGNGTAGGTLSGNVLNANTQYNLNGNRILTNLGTNNLFAGVGAGQANTSGDENSFFGRSAGLVNTLGRRNSFFGSYAGEANNGSENSFYGLSAGNRNTQGSGNTFIGFIAGLSNTIGSKNTAIGYGADIADDNLENATAIGANAAAIQSNTLVLGSIAGFNNATASVFVGIGTTRPTQKLAVQTSSAGAQTLITLNVPNTVGNNGALDFAVNNAGTILPIAVAKVAAIYGAVNDIGLAFSTFNANGIAERVRIDKSGNVGIGTTTPTERLSVNGNLTVFGSIKIGGPGLGGDAPLCRNSSQEIAFCTSSSLRYKTRIAPFSAGLELIRRLRPISFAWKADGRRDLGLGAEDVAKVEPLLVTHNDKGEIEGVRYDRLNVVLINAIKQQQDQIERQRAEAKQQQEQIGALRTANAVMNARLRAVERVLRKRDGSFWRRR